ncbi:hypothetical protein VTL71DRAFT_7732 [Oculimacula yallundae]|uniref:Uncharacterized protein n=1 Tax=Oculimacula yallundae TaxID=86028 RepID=A0ABR4CY16_9HELO
MRLFPWMNNFFEAADWAILNQAGSVTTCEMFIVWDEVKPLIVSGNSYTSDFLLVTMKFADQKRTMESTASPHPDEVVPESSRTKRRSKVDDHLSDFEDEDVRNATDDDDDLRKLLKAPKRAVVKRRKVRRKDYADLTAAEIDRLDEIEDMSEPSDTPSTPVKTPSKKTKTQLEIDSMSTQLATWIREQLVANPYSEIPEAAIAEFLVRSTTRIYEDKISSGAITPPVNSFISADDPAWHDNTVKSRTTRFLTARNIGAFLSPKELDTETENKAKRIRALVSVAIKAYRVASYHHSESLEGEIETDKQANIADEPTPEIDHVTYLERVQEGLDAPSQFLAVEAEDSKMTIILFDHIDRRLELMHKKTIILFDHIDRRLELIHKKSLTEYLDVDMPILSWVQGDDSLRHKVNELLIAPPTIVISALLLKQSKQRCQQFLHTYDHTLPLTSSVSISDDSSPAALSFFQRITTAIEVYEQRGAEEFMDLLLKGVKVQFLLSWNVNTTSFEDLIADFSEDDDDHDRNIEFVEQSNTVFRMMMLKATLYFVVQHVAKGYFEDFKTCSNRKVRISLWISLIKSDVLQDILDFCAGVLDWSRLDTHTSSSYLKECVARLADDILVYQVLHDEIDLFSEWIFQYFPLVMVGKFVEFRLKVPQHLPLVA